MNEATLQNQDFFFLYNLVDNGSLLGCDPIIIFS